jgi:hypothetical protein
MGSLWIVRRGDQERGPFTSPELRSLANSGQLRRTDLVTKQGENRYVPAEKVKGLFSAPPGNTSKNTTALTAPKAQAPAKAKTSDEEGLDFGVVEIIEEDDIIVLEEPKDEIIEGDDVVVLEEPKDEFDLFNFDTNDADDDFDEPKPSRSGRSGSSRRETRPERGRSAAPSRRSSALDKPAKPKKPAKTKKGDEDEDEENSPWLNVFYGVICVFAGICLFIALGKEDPSTWETRRGAALVAIVRLIYNIGGKWMVLGLAIALSLLFFWFAFDKFRKAQ